jgi:hypothetical protein
VVPSHRGWVVQLGVGVESGGGQLVRRPARYKSGVVVPTLPGEKPNAYDSDAVDCCKWCGLRCRAHLLSCTMSLKMIMDVQNHMRKRNVEFSWFDRMDITIRTSTQGGLSGSTSSLMSGQRVCNNCYELYVTEQKLMRAEKLFARAVGLPIPHRQAGTLPRNLTPVPQPPPHMRPQAPLGISASDTKCFRFLTFLGELEQFPVPLLFGVSGLCLQYTFLGHTTTIPLDVDAAALESIVIPGTSPKGEPPAELAGLLGDGEESGHGVVAGEPAEPRGAAAVAASTEADAGAPASAPAPAAAAAGSTDGGGDLDGGDGGGGASPAAAPSSNNPYVADKVDTSVGDGGAGAQPSPKGSEKVRTTRSLFTGKAQRERQQREEAAELERRRANFEAERERVAKEEAARKLAEVRAQAGGRGGGVARQTCSP